MEVEYMMQTTVVMLLLVVVYDCVHMVLPQDLYTILVLIVGAGVVLELMVVLVQVVVQMNCIVVMAWCKVEMENNVNQIKQVVMQVVCLIQV